MSETDRDALIAQFTSVTGAAPDFASSFLAAADWNVQQALNMYLGGGGTEAMNLAGTQETPNTNNNRPQRPAPDNGLIERARAIMESQGVDESTAMAIAEAQGEPVRDNVRAPIAPTTTRLIDRETRAFNDTQADLRRMEQRMRQVAGGRGGLSTAFGRSMLDAAFNPTMNGRDFDDDEDDDSDYEMEDDEPRLQVRNENRRNLQDLFSPPRDLIFQGSWEQARSLGKEVNKWILVNIQKDSEFLSYNFNRDLWCNEIVKDLVLASFVFFQREENEREGQRFINLYHPPSLPHVAIVDPFTGEKRLDLKLSTFNNNSADMLSGFLEQVNDFLEKNQLEGEKIKKLQAKLQERFKLNDARRLVRTEVTLPISPATPVVAEQDQDVQILNELEDLEDEPAAGPYTTTVQVRLFDKRTVRRRFRKDQRVKDIFLFVKHEIEEARTRDFDLVCFPQKSLKNVQNETLIDQKLNNTTVSAVFI